MIHFEDDNKELQQWDQQVFDYSLSISFKSLSRNRDNTSSTNLHIEILVFIVPNPVDGTDLDHDLIHATKWIMIRFTIRDKEKKQLAYWAKVGSWGFANICVLLQLVLPLLQIFGLCQSLNDVLDSAPIANSSSLQSHTGVANRFKCHVSRVTAMVKWDAMEEITRSLLRFWSSM